MVWLEAPIVWVEFWITVLTIWDEAVVPSIVSSRLPGDDASVSWTVRGSRRRLTVLVSPRESAAVSCSSR